MKPRTTSLITKTRQLRRRIAAPRKSSRRAKYLARTKKSPLARRRNQRARPRTLRRRPTIRRSVGPKIRRIASTRKRKVRSEIRASNPVQINVSFFKCLHSGPKPRWVPLDIEPPSVRPKSQKAKSGRLPKDVSNNTQEARKATGKGQCPTLAMVGLINERSV